uniref:NADH-ubiquinone oxidoreductase chain 6 n=1 Tax=Scydmaeninae sp. 840139 TaxID=1213609 RepID=A0A0S2MS26_9COLE|nr:NADH deshydrogenase subunit 6 [Scydmaeninae sp. 840139]
MMLMISFYSMMFMFLNHPLSMGIILMIQTFLVCLITGMMISNFWLSYILFLIMVGGMLILFMYMTSIASNEKFKFSNKIFLYLMISIMMLIFFMLKDNFFLILMNSYQMKMFLNFNLSKFFNYPYNFMLMLLIIYLFITLIATVKIINMKMGPLRQIN